MEPFSFLKTQMCRCSSAVLLRVKEGNEDTRRARAGRREEGKSVKKMRRP